MYIKNFQNREKLPNTFETKFYDTIWEKSSNEQLRHHFARYIG